MAGVYVIFKISHIRGFGFIARANDLSLRKLMIIYLPLWYMFYFPRDLSHASVQFVVCSVVAYKFQALNSRANDMKS